MDKMNGNSNGLQKELDKKLKDMVDLEKKKNNKINQIDDKNRKLEDIIDKLQNQIK